MAERAGIGGQLGVGVESTPGTYTAPTKFLFITSESLTLTKNSIEGQAIRAGQLVQASNLHQQTTRTVGGDVNFEFLNQSMGSLVNMLHGETVTPTKIGTSTAYKQVHKIGANSPWGKSLTVQAGRPDVGGTVRAFSYLGCKFTSFSISVDQGGAMTATASVDGIDEVTGETLATPTYPVTAIPYTFQQMEVKIAGTKAANMRQLSLQVELPMATDRFNLGNSGKKEQQILNGPIKITASATLEFASLADHERYTNFNTFSLEALAKGSLIAESNYFGANFIAPCARQTSSGPVIAGPDIITQDVSYMIESNGTEAPLTVELISTDTTL